MNVPPDLREWLRRALFVAGGAFVVVLAWHSHDSLAEAGASADPVRVVLATALAVAANVLMAGAFRGLLAKSGLVVTSRAAAELLLYAQVAKYVPGKVWLLVYQSARLGPGASLSALITANVELVAMAIASSSAIAGAVLAAPVSPIAALAALAAGAAGALAVFRSRALARVLAGVARRLGRQARAGTGAAPGPGPALVFVLATWALYFPAMVLLLDGVFGLGTTDAARLAAAHLVATVAGALTLVFPAGLGIREALFLAVAGLLPSAAVDSGTLVAVAVVLRAWQMLHDVVAAALLRAVVGPSDRCRSAEPDQ